MEWKGVKYAYENEKPISFDDYKINDGENALILGASGSGKTTLMHLLCGLLKPTVGTITVNGKSIEKLSSEETDIFRGENMGIIFQKSFFVKSLTVLENILLACQFAGYQSSKGEAREILKELQILEQENKYPHQLSVGQQQRASIARAIIHKPKYILADEPTAALDDNNCMKVIDLLLNQAKENNASLLVVTHDNRIMDRFDNKFKV